MLCLHKNFCYLCITQATQKKMNTTDYQIHIAESETILLPSFTFTHTLTGGKREPCWVKAKEAVSALHDKGVSTTTQTLFNMEGRGELNTRRISTRNIQFDLHEIFTKFHITK